MWYFPAHHSENHFLFPTYPWNINIKSPLHIIAEYCLFGFKNFSVGSRVDPCPRPLPSFLHACGSICWEQLRGQRQGELTPCCPEPSTEQDKTGGMGRILKTRSLRSTPGSFLSPGKSLLCLENSPVVCWHKGGCEHLSWPSLLWEQSCCINREEIRAFGMIASQDRQPELCAHSLSHCPADTALSFRDFRFKPWAEILVPGPTVWTTPSDLFPWGKLLFSLTEK